MRLFIFGFLFFAIGLSSDAQRCFSSLYQEKLQEIDGSTRFNSERVEAFVQAALSQHHYSREGDENLPIIKIPVVVHILYHTSAENISDELVISQIDALNQCFRRLHPDTINTPARFVSSAADCRIEFILATSDAQHRKTKGIIHRYTPVAQWQTDDLVKYSAQAGDDAWDANNYFNIWVCNLYRGAGYSSIPGGSPEKDGVVIGYPYFGVAGRAGYEFGKTMVHETGHWLGLRHVWGDAYCGDDLVGDTPQQATFTGGCPSGIRLSCNNATDGDMYMNYMDLTLDACTNLFTYGQRDRVRALFAPGGARYALLSGIALQPPLYPEATQEEEMPIASSPHLYPNPASSMVNLDLSSDIRWIGQVITISTLQGQRIMSLTASSKLQTINVGRLPAGVYIVSAKKGDGTFIKQKFIKL